MILVPNLRNEVNGIKDPEALSNPKADPGKLVD
jgi:hypothetical protein